MNYVDILILGAGWTSDFLIPLLLENDLTFAATTRDGRTRSGYETIQFDFDPDSEDSSPFRALPESLKHKLYLLHSQYTRVEDQKPSLASGRRRIRYKSCIYTTWVNGNLEHPTLNSNERPIWCDRHSAFNTSNDRARAETELLKLAPSDPTTVLDLSGLWGGQRSDQNWVRHIASSKEALSQKGSLHLIHGIDVGRAILAVHLNFAAASGQRWLLADGRVYDWWDLASAWGEGSTSSSSNADKPRSSTTVLGPQPAWVRELMAEAGIHALPRPPSAFDRALDSREFWDTFELSPVKTLLSS